MESGIMAQNRMGQEYNDFKTLTLMVSMVRRRGSKYCGREISMEHI
jgi:hypothetical protein